MTLDELIGRYDGLLLDRSLERQAQLSQLRCKLNSYTRSFAWLRLNHQITTN